MVNYSVNCKVAPACFLPKHESRCFPEPGGVRVPRRPPEPATSPLGNVEFTETPHAKTQLLAKVALNLELPHGETSNSYKNITRKLNFSQKHCSAPRNTVIREGCRPRSGKSGVLDAASQRRTHTAAQSQSVSPTCPPPTHMSQSSHLGACLIGLRILSCWMYPFPASLPFAAIRHSHDQS